MDYAFMGSISLVAFNFAPPGWMFCNGQILLINQYAALFSLIGTTFGGDGLSTFALPNMPTGATQTGLSFMICVAGVFPTRS